PGPARRGAAAAADPRVHVDAADPNPRVAWFHGPHYAPGTPTRGGRPMERTPLAVTLGDFVAALTFQTLPPTVVDKAKALVNHAVTVGLAGAASSRSVAARRAVI